MVAMGLAAVIWLGRFVMISVLLSLRFYLASLEKGYAMFMLDKCPEEGNSPRHSH
jgi:hypothetical protein